MEAVKCYRASRSDPACPEVVVDGIKPSTFSSKVINIFNMQADKLLKVITQLTKDAEAELNNRLPRKVAVIDKRRIRDNFRLSGFVDGGLHQWQRAIR